VSAGRDEAGLFRRGRVILQTMLCAAASRKIDPSCDTANKAFRDNDVWAYSKR
jgi:hypothetical protein